MPEYNEQLTLAWFAFRFYLSEIGRHEQNARAYEKNPQATYLAKSREYLALARYRAAKWLAKFYRLVRDAGGFVFVDRFVYVEMGVVSA